MQEFSIHAWAAYSTNPSLRLFTGPSNRGGNPIDGSATYIDPTK